ncbi:MAG: PilZ domain-containing protein [Thermodesulfobacteriota bacterium]|nr:PilZ domain-containing protein [Thermodesulfobacteriota bacterium]
MPFVERRQWKRLPLKVFGSFNTCAVALDKGSILDCTLLDIGCGGLRIRINTEKKKISNPEEGQGIEFKSFLSKRYMFLTGKTGVVVWYNALSREFGIKFNEILSEFDIENCVRQPGDTA